MANIGDRLSSIRDELTQKARQKSAQTATAPQTARQRMMLDEDDEDKWYRGTMPTSSESLARIYTIAKSDPQQGQKLFDAFTSFQSDPSTPFYNPYSRATNRAIDEIAALGVDTSGGIGSDWLQRNASLMNSYRMGTGTSPLAPSSKSTREQNAAYWYYKIADAEETTQKAETEWDALQEEITYWAGRSDRNYSDDEILSRIDWSQYKTLTAMDEARQKGTPMTLNRAIGYSQDALYGAIWAARNGGGTGNPMIDGVKAALGEGNQWQENTDISDRLDPTSDRYNPYSVGATLDDAALYFGVPSFDQTWLDGNRAYLAGSDKTAKKYYGKVYDAEQTTQKAESEMKTLQARIDFSFSYGGVHDPETVLADLLDGDWGFLDDAGKLTTLAKMDESRKSGDLLATTRAINYRWEDIEAEVRRRCQTEQEAARGRAYALGMTELLGGEVQQVTDSQKAIDEAKNSAVGAASATIRETGTDAEKTVWQTAYGADFDESVTKIAQDVVNGKTTPQQGYDRMLAQTNEMAAKNYLPALESGDEQAIASIRQANTLSDRLAAMVGAKAGSAESAVSVIDYIYQYGKDYTPTAWTAQSLYDVALEQGIAIEEVRAAAKQGAQEMQVEIARIDAALAYADSHSIVIDRKYLDNLSRRRAALERDLLDAQYFELSGSEDFERVAQETAQKVSKAWSGFSLMPTIFGRDGYTELDYAMADVHGAMMSNSLAKYMTDMEKKTYLYLLDTQGRDAAKAYYDHLANEENGVLQTRQTHKGTEFWQAYTQEHPVSGNVLSVIASPMQAAGSIYALKAQLMGEEINPNASAFAASKMNAVIRGTSKEMITKELGEGTVASFLANLGYDAVMSGADSMMNGALTAGFLPTVGGKGIKAFGKRAAVDFFRASPMGASAMSSAIMDAKQRGATNVQALKVGGVNFLAETLSEAVTVDNMSKAFSGDPKEAKGFFRKLLSDDKDKPFIKELLGNMAEEGVAEGLTEAIEQVTDEQIMGILSDRSASIQNYMHEGMTQEEATEQANRDTMHQILYAALVGSMSSVVSTTTSKVAGRFTRRDQTSPEGQNGVSRPAQTGTEEVPTEAPTGGEETRQPGTEGTGAQTGTEEAPAGNEETQQPGTESAEAPPSLTEEESALLVRQQAALAQALTTEDTASRTATLAGVLAAEGGDFEATSAASAAAQHMMTQYGSQTAIEMTQEILLTAAELRMSGETLRAALHTAALGEGASAAVLSQIMTEGPSTQLLGSLVDAASEDVSSPAVQETMRKAVTDNQIATRVKALIADGALSGLRSYEESVSKARGALRAAQMGYASAQRDSAAAAENLQSVQAQAVQNANDAALAGKMTQAIKDVGGKIVVVEQYRQSMENAQEKLSHAQKALDSVRDETMKRIREQAQQEVMQAKEQAQTERAKQKAEKEAKQTSQREMDNLNAMDADDFIEQNYPDATDEQKQAIRERYMQLAQAEQTGKNEAMAGGVSLLMRASRKYGFKVVIKDSMNDAEGSYDRKMNTLYASKAITQSEAIRRVLIHEMTHAAEGGQGSYDRLRRTILDIRYGKDTQRLEADIAATQREYNAFFEANGIVDEETGKTRTMDREGALEEITARSVSELLSGNEEMVNRLVDKEPSVARQILDAIRRFIDRMRGVNDPEMDQLRRVERMLYKAIREAQGSADGSRDGMQYAIGWTKDGERFVRIEEDILDGVPQKDWAKTVSLAMKEKFPNGITVGNKLIQITKKSRREITNAHDTMWLKANQPDMYANKLRAANNAGEIVQASTDYVDEGLNHERKDGIADFARGKVNIEVGGQMYSAEVVVGTRRNGEMLLYDFVRMTKKEMQRTAARQSAAHGSHAASLSDKSVAQGTPDVNSQSMRNDVQYSVPGDNQTALPSDDVLDREIASFMAMQNTRTTGDGANGDEPSPNRPMRERQFATQTAQRSQAIPQWLKNELINDPNERYYETDTNNDQIVRSWERLQTEGYEAMRDRLLAADATLDNADDVADANMLMAMANREGDMQTLLDIARHYNKEGTRQAKAFQARKIFSRMTPAGVRTMAAGDCENRLGIWMEGHKPARQSADKKAAKIADKIRQLQGGDELQRLEAASEYTITKEDAKYGVPINEQQRELIRQFGLENVNRPVFYNKATRQQRMLEAILMEPNPLNATGFGLNLIERLTYCQSGAPVIFNSDLDYIGYNMAQFASAPLDEQEDRFGDLALSRVYETYGNITEATLREKARTWKYTSMLLSLPSAGRNVIGNAAQNTVNAASHSLAAALDAAVGQITGRRTRANITIRELAGGWNAFVRETVNTYRDYFVDRAVTQRGEDRFNLNQRGRVYQNNALETLRTLESFLMSVGDRNFWRMAYANSMAEQQRVARLNGEELDFETANERARQDANFATFTEDSAVRDGLAALKRVPIIGDVLDILMPFTGVPTNIIGRMWQYSPGGLAEAVIRHGFRGITGQTFDQAAFVDGMARGLTGTAMVGIGALLYSIGFIKLGTGDEDDKKVYGVRSAQGDQYSPYIQLGDENISLAAFSPAASALTMGAVAYDTLKDSDDAIDALMNACFGGLDQIFDASYMTALQDLFNGVRTTGSFSESLTNSVFSNAVSQNVPSLFGQLATALDPYVRDTKDRNAIMQAIKTGIVNKVPGLRQMLPEKVDVAGRSVTSKEGLANFFDPLNRTKVVSDPALTELMRLNETLDKSDFMPSDALSGTKTALTGVAEPVEGKDKEAYRKRYGELWRIGGTTYDANGQRVTIQGVDSLIHTSAYQSMSDEEKANAIGGIVSAAKTGATYEMGEKLGHIEKAEKNSGYAKKPVRSMPEQFADSDSPMIKRLADKYEETGDGAFIPKGISQSFSVNKVSYSLEGEEYDLLWSLYEKELNGKLKGIDWARLSDEELAAAVENAYSSAATAAKNQYAKKHK